MTLLPQVTGQRNRRRLASPLHGTLTPGGSLSAALHAWQDGSIIVSDGIIAKQPATDCFWTDGNRWAPYILAALMESLGRLVHFLCIPISTGGLGASSGVACLSRQEAPSGTYLSLRIFYFQGALVILQEPFQQIELYEDRVQHDQILADKGRPDAFQEVLLP